MSGRLVVAKDVYAYVGELPRGCKLCMRGAKSVIFITGLCDDMCPYCPVSRARLGKDVVYANEERVRSLEGLVEEVESAGSEGVGVTGGDPLLVLPRLISVIKVLKDYLGESFHVHLYTTGRYATADVLKVLERAGVDELRFHPINNSLWSRVVRAVEILKRVEVGVEVPVFPDKVEELKKRIAWLDTLGVTFINLNEVEVTPDNVDYLLESGYEVKGYTVKGSYEAGIEVVRWASENTRRINVHFCPASFKDAVQTRNRLLRKALRVAKPYEYVTKQGTLLFAEASVFPSSLVEESYGEVIGRRLRTSLEVAIKMGLADAEAVEALPSAARLPMLTRRPIRALYSLLEGQDSKERQSRN